MQGQARLLSPDRQNCLSLSRCAIQSRDGLDARPRQSGPSSIGAGRSGVRESRTQENFGRPEGRPIYQLPHSHCSSTRKSVSPTRVTRTDRSIGPLQLLDAEYRENVVRIDRTI